jgi:hypothetical protein
MTRNFIVVKYNSTTPGVFPVGNLERQAYSPDLAPSGYQLLPAPKDEVMT